MFGEEVLSGTPSPKNKKIYFIKGLIFMFLESIKTIYYFLFLRIPFFVDSVDNLIYFFEYSLLFKSIITLKKTMSPFPFFPFEEYFKNPKETISKFKEDYQNLEKANQMMAKSYKTMVEFHEQGAKYYHSLIEQLELVEKQQEFFMKVNPLNFFKELMEKYADFNKKKK